MRAILRRRWKEFAAGFVVGLAIQATIAWFMVWS